MVQPLDVAADPSTLESLVRNLKDLRRSPESGTITGPAETYGLRTPAKRHPPLAYARRILVDRPGPRHPGDRQDGPGATYVRPSGAAGDRGRSTRSSWAISTVPKRSGASRISCRSRPSRPPAWPFTASDFDLKAEHGGRAMAADAPVSVPANGAKIESALAALSAIRVVDGGKGFVADNVTDFKPYGLNKPEATIEFTTAAQPDAPLVLQIGRKPADQPDRVYVRRGDQDDVVLVERRFLSEIPADCHRVPQPARHRDRARGRLGDPDRGLEDDVHRRSPEATAGS